MASFLWTLVWALTLWTTFTSLIYMQPSQPQNASREVLLVVACILWAILIVFWFN